MDERTLCKTYTVKTMFVACYSVEGVKKKTLYLNIYIYELFVSLSFY